MRQAPALRQQNRSLFLCAWCAEYPCLVQAQPHMGIVWGGYKPDYGVKSHNIRGKYKKKQLRNGLFYEIMKRMVPVPAA